MNLYMNCAVSCLQQIPSFAFVAAWLICKWHTKHLDVVKLWQVKDSYVIVFAGWGMCACLCALIDVGLYAHVCESDRVGVLLCCEIS